MVLIDTSVLVAVLLDLSGATGQRLLAAIGAQEIVMARAIRTELLAGAKNDIEWAALESYIDAKTMFETQVTTWHETARIYFDLRKAGLTIRKLYDCGIAQVALENNLTLLHNDRDFDAIATIRPLKHIHLDLSTPTP